MATLRYQRGYISCPPDFSTSQLSCSYPSFFSFFFIFVGLLPVGFPSLPPQTVELKAACEESVFWCGGVRERVHWWLDCSAVAVLSEDRTEGVLCTVAPSTGSLGPGQSVCLEVRITPDAIGTGEKWGEHTHTHTHMVVYLITLLVDSTNLSVSHCVFVPPFLLQ